MSDEQEIQAAEKNLKGELFREKAPRPETVGELLDKRIIELEGLVSQLTQQLNQATIKTAQASAALAEAKWVRANVLT